MKKTISFILSLICALSCASLAGCGEKDSAQVYFLNFKPESASVYEELAKKYEEEKGVKVKVVTAAADGAGHRASVPPASNGRSILATNTFVS